MMFYALTLIANTKLSPLESIHIERAFQCLGLQGETDWLAKSEACDLFIHSDLSAKNITKRVRGVLAEAPIDVVCTPARSRRKKLLISDMDSTVIDQECIDELADAINIGPQVREITTAVINGDIGFSEGLLKRLKLMKGMDHQMLKRIYEQRITLKSGARTLVQTMRHHGAFCILVSGGFTFFTRRIAERLGFHDHQGNQLLLTNSKLTGKVREPILGKSAKLKTLNCLCDEKGLRLIDVLAVGDGANDIKMIKAAGLGVAFHDSGSLRKSANAYIRHNDLTALLYIQGFHKSEFVLR